MLGSDWISCVGGARTRDDLLWPRHPWFLTFSLPQHAKVVWHILVYNWLTRAVILNQSSQNLWEVARREEERQKGCAKLLGSLMHRETGMMSKEALMMLHTL